MWDIWFHTANEKNISEVLMRKSPLRCCWENHFANTIMNLISKCLNYIWKGQLWNLVNQQSEWVHRQKSSTQSAERTPSLTYHGHFCRVVWFSFFLDKSFCCLLVNEFSKPTIFMDKKIYIGFEKQKIRTPLECLISSCSILIMYDLSWPLFFCGVIFDYFYTIPLAGH